MVIIKVNALQSYAVSSYYMHIKGGSVRNIHLLINTLGWQCQI